MGMTKTPFDIEQIRPYGAVRRPIYTTDATEGFDRQLRKVTKGRSLFPTDDSLLKMPDLAMTDIAKTRTGRRQDRSLIHAQPAVFFADRMPDRPAETRCSPFSETAPYPTS